MGNPNWVKGVSGNPGGRPRRRNTWAAALARVGCERDENGVTRKIRTARRHYEKAENGDLGEWIAIMEREDGKPVQPIAGSDTYPPVSVRMIEVFENAADGGDDSESAGLAEDFRD
uniref:DUF5681 domain-containing protein n=1 Tax=viral metagenome TaxID=1070528 RepID=A0A6M3JBQ5_9ZZZZ